MLKEDRFLQIVNYLKENNVATFAELSKITGSSVGTIRHDLTELEAKGMLSVVRGGAAWRKDDLTRQSFDMRGIENRREKEELSRLLAHVVTDGQAVAMNSGTTNIEAAKFLAKNYKRLTILTNNMRIVEVLQENPGFLIVVPGGILRNEEHSICGKLCEEEILSYNFDTAILAVNALSSEKGITDFRMEEVGVVRAMLAASKSRIVVADHTKFDRIACINVCQLSEIDCILTDSLVSKEQKERYKEKGAVILTPDKAGDNR